MTPTDIRRIVAEAVKRGCRVKVEPDGTVEITPPPVPEGLPQGPHYVTWMES